ncbi:MAG: HPF/RaiA family ribosome-associated protein [Paludibacteraceae bacterium]|nr:HPF/RaiA family ribosome-associated protein [Candidatus Colicola coprequi]MCQ2333206.1 HPF/RaiA family ribosome-associated protein [Paludibacteraceae bacterium]
MKLTINPVNFDIAERLSKYIVKKTNRYNKILNNPGAEMEIRMTVVKPETNLNKQVTIRIIGNGAEMFAEKTCDTFEQSIDIALEAIDKQIEKLKDK